VGSILLIVLFFFLTWRILHVATISWDRFGVLIAVGVVTTFTVSRVRQRRDDDENNAGDRHTAAFHQLWAEQPGGQRPLFRLSAEHRHALEGRGLEASERIAASWSMRRMPVILSLRTTRFVRLPESAKS
jgi:hypothetical protein